MVIDLFLAELLIVLVFFAVVADFLPETGLTVILLVRTGLIIAVLCLGLSDTKSIDLFTGGPWRFSVKSSVLR